MKYTTIPKTDIKVSKICLGTMTWGEQNTEAEAHEQLNYAFNQGVNFIDTAEMYSVPGRKETSGNTERYIGSWLKNQQREKLVIASKITGPNPGLSYIRGAAPFTKESIMSAVEGNLQRLQTDYLDLYQLHWPDRNTNFFGKLNYKHDDKEQWEDRIAVLVETMDNLVKMGKIRHYGLSNETPWGVMRHLNEADKNNLSRCKTIQNPYSLVNRTYEIGLAEMSMREQVGLLAYSPLAFGVLTGKYLEKLDTENSRLNLFPVFSRYNGDKVTKLVTAYYNYAKELNISLTHLALAFVNHQPWVTANIIGATNMEQLKENINSIDVLLTPEILQQIDKIQEIQPNPAP